MERHASQGENLAAVALTTAMFGLGAAGALSLVGVGARALIARGTLRKFGESGKRFLGWALVLMAVLTLTQLDRALEAALVEASPAWL